MGKNSLKRGEGRKKELVVATSHHEGSAGPSAGKITGGNEGIASISAKAEKGEGGRETPHRKELGRVWV